MFDIYKLMWEKRKMVHTLALQEMKKEYAGTLLGIVWGLINPLLRIAVFWFVFSIGARAGNSVGGTPFIAWLACGLVAWFFINDAFKTSKNSFRSKRGLIKNTPFPIAVLPVVNVLYSYYIHLILLAVILIVMVFYLKGISVYWLQILYFDFSAFMLLIGIGAVTAPLVAVSKDFGKLVDTVLIFLFWMTPILWSVDNLNGPLKYLVQLNPFNYIVQGYRDSMFFNTGFWEYPLYTLYFWVFVFVSFVLGNYLYKRLKPIFLDLM